MKPADLKKPKEETSTIPANKVADDYNINIVEDYDGKIDPFSLSNKDPKYVYRFLRDEHKNIHLKTSNMLYQKGGWQICGSEHCKRIGIASSELSPDGLCRRGDTVLAFMPKELFKKKDAAKKREAKEPSDAIRRLIAEGDPNAGGREMHDSMKGIQTGKALGMK